MARKKSGAPADVADPAVEESKSKLTDQQVALGAFNKPALSNDTFELNGKTYKYVHLSYDFYVEFMLKIKPLLTAVMGVVASKAKATISLPGIELAENPLSGILQFCSADVPDMVRIIVNNTLQAEGSSESITVAEIKASRGVTPMQLSEIIMGQVAFNKMITDFASFFVQTMPLLKAMGILTQPKA